MPKAEKSWSGMRRYLEREMLAPALRGRVRYDCAAYPGMQHGIRFQVFVDGRPVRQFSMETMASWLYTGERPVDLERFWAEYCQIRESVPASSRTVHDDGEFAAALRYYRGAEIGAALASENPVVRMFAILDRRVGKRTLGKLRPQIAGQPEWLRFFYALRLSAEGLSGESRGSEAADLPGGGE